MLSWTETLTCDLSALGGIRSPHLIRSTSKHWCLLVFRDPAPSAFLRATAGAIAGPVHDACHRRRLQRAARGVDMPEQAALHGRSAPLDVGRQGPSNIGREGQRVDSAALAPHPQHAARPVDVVQFQSGDLARPKLEPCRQHDRGKSRRPARVRRSQPVSKAASSVGVKAFGSEAAGHAAGAGTASANGTRITSSSSKNRSRDRSEVATHLAHPLLLPFAFGPS